MNRVELFIVFAEIKTAVVEAFDEVFVRNLFAWFIKFLFAFVEFLHFLVESREYNVFGNKRLWDHDIEDIFVGVDFGEYFLEERGVEIFIIYDSGDGALNWGNVLVDLVLFLLIFEELLFELIFACDDKAAFGAQGYGAADSVEKFLAGVNGPAFGVIGVAIGDDNVTVADLLDGVLRIDEVGKRGENGEFSAWILKLFGVLEEHVEGGGVTQVYWLDEWFELLEGNYAASVKT